MVDARLSDGSRVNAIIPPLAVNGASLTIRKFGQTPLTVDNLITFGTLTPEMAELLHACVQARLNILVSGGTGTGKTTLLNVLSSFLPADERIVTIEDAVELQLQQEHVVRLESRPRNIEGKGEISIRDLVRNSLRMRPDRIVIGEVRGGESLDMLQAMNTGHDGSISTVHANSPRDAIARLETLVLMAGMDLPLRAIREQIASAVNLIVHISRLRDGTRRVTHVTEVQGMEGDIVTLQDAFTFDYSAGLDANGRFLGRPTIHRGPASLCRPFCGAGHPAFTRCFRRRAHGRWTPVTATSPIFFALGIGLCLVALGILLFSTMGMGKAGIALSRRRPGVKDETSLLTRVTDHAVTFVDRNVGKNARFGRGNRWSGRTETPSRLTSSS